ncbi:MAG: ATP-binding protein [Propionivibrio sp.]
MNERARVREMRSRLPGALLTAALLILILLASYQLWLSYDNQVRAAEVSTRNLAAVFETRLDMTLRRTDADLVALAKDIPVAALSQENASSYAHEINAKLDGRLFSVDEMAGYRVHDANGDTLYSSDSAKMRRVNVADRAYFKALRENPDRGLIFSDVLIGRSTGKQVIVIARALRDEQGRFAGIVHGMLELEYYRKQFRLLDLGDHGFVALRRSDNHALVIQTPENASAVNRRLSIDHPIAQGVGSGAKTLNLQYADALDGRSRIVGIQTVPDFPFYFAVGFGRSDVLAGWRIQMAVVVLSTLLLFCLVAALIRRLGRMRVREAGILDNLAQSETQFSELAQLVPVGIAHFDAQGCYTFVNGRHRALTGRSVGDSIGKKWSEFVHPDDRKKLAEVWDRRVVPKHPFICEYRFVRPDGQITHVIGEVRTETDSQGNVVGYIVAQTDITQRKRAEAELLVAKQQAESANLAKTRFLAAASHDLRQPIQAINLFRDALGRTELDEEQKTICNFLSMSVHSLGDLLYSLIDISKLEAGLVVPQLENLSVEELFKAVDAEFSPLMQQKNLRFKLFYPIKDMVLVTDPRLLLSVLRNLIDNAVKYTEAGGVLVGARCRGRGMIIQVWDTGIGIEAQYGDQVFEECFQIGNAIKDRTKGLGIGLSIARRAVALLNGEINYRSRPGRGSVFEIRLPEVSVGRTPDEKEQESESFASSEAVFEESSRVAGWRVAVIEDDPVVAKSVEISLQTLGVSVDVFFSAEGALESPGILGADFYISDFNLPGIDGVQFLNRIQQASDRPIRAVLMTGETAMDQVELASLSRWPVLFKPVGLNRLVVLMNDGAAFR